MRPWLDDGDVRLYHGGAEDVLRALPEQSIQTCVTSPPYYGLRDYGTGEWDGGNPACDHDAAVTAKATAVVGTTGFSATNNSGRAAARGRVRASGCPSCGARPVDRQLGLEGTPAEYVARMVAVFREVRRVLRDDGTVWLNVGDSYAAGRTGRADRESLLDNDVRRGFVRDAAVSRQVRPETTGTRTAPEGCKSKDLLGIPWALAFALREPWYSGRITDERDRIWLAAMIDAEGCIHVHRRPAGQKTYANYVRKDGSTADYVRKQDTYGVMVSIDNTSAAVIDRCAEIVGQGSRYTHEAGAGVQQRKQTLYRLTLTGQQARELLREVYPYLVAKQREARIAYGSPSSGEGAHAAHEAIKLLHNGSDTTVDYPAPPSLHEGGWYLRSENIWSKKPNPMPESVTDRPTRSHEQVFLLAKSPRYFFDQEAVREPQDAPRASGRWTGPVATTGDNNGRRLEVPNPAGRNIRSVWTIATQPYPEAHFATFPEALVRPCILAGTPEQACGVCGAPWERVVASEANGKPRNADEPHNAGTGLAPHSGYRGSRIVQTLDFRPTCEHDDGSGRATVLDPFIGSGTSALVARKHGRRAVGIDLSEDYLRLASRRLAQGSLLAV